MKKEKFYTTKEISKKLDVSVSSICRWVRQGKLKARKYTIQSWKISAEALRDFIKRADK